VLFGLAALLHHVVAVDVRRETVVPGLDLGDVRPLEGEVTSIDVAPPAEMPIVMEEAVGWFWRQTLADGE
jgi:hypothetical protein